MSEKLLPTAIVEVSRRTIHQLFKDLNYYAGVGFVTTKQFREAREGIYKEMDDVVLEWADAIKRIRG